MLFQLLLNLIVFFLRCAIWVLVALVAIPYGIFMLLHNIFPVFTQDAGFWWWIVFSIITIIAYVVLWKPILWIVGAIGVLGAGQ
jgi:hypothetical protein